MSMNTPIGNISQITPITSFVTLSQMALDQYLLGINTMAQGDGAKITLQNLIESMVSEDDKNILSIGEDGKLKAVEVPSAFGNDTGWAVAPTLSIDFETRIVTGTGGVAYKNGYIIEALSDFESPAYPMGNGFYWLYYDLNNNSFNWATSEPKTSNMVLLIAKVDVGADGTKMAVVRWEQGGIGSSIREFLNGALGTLRLSGGNIDGVTVDKELTQLQPNISQTKIGTVDFNYTLPALLDKSYTRVYSNTNTLIYETEQSSIVPTHYGNIPILIDGVGEATELSVGAFENIWLIGLPLFDSNPSEMEYQFAIGSTSYNNLNDAKNASPQSEISMQIISGKYDRYAILARFTIERTQDGFTCADYTIYNPLSSGGSGGGSGLVEVSADQTYFSGVGTASSALTMSEYTQRLLDEVDKDVNNIYKVIEGHKSTEGHLWDLIEFHDNSDADNVLIGGTESTEDFTSNTSSSNFHFQMLDSVIGSNQPAAANKLLAYQLFKPSSWASNTYVNIQDATLVIICNKPTKISAIDFMAYYNYTQPSIIHVLGANISGAMGREITLSDLETYGRYIGGVSYTYASLQGAGGGGGSSTTYYRNQLKLNLNNEDTYNVFFICMSHWCSGGQGWNRLMTALKVYGSQREDDTDYTVKMNGNYETCKWISSNGTLYDTADLNNGQTINTNQFKDEVHRTRWISCFGCGIGFSETTRASNAFYPCMVEGRITTTKISSGSKGHFGMLRQTNYSNEPRNGVGYNTNAGYLQVNTVINNQTVVEYTANDEFPIGEYYWECIFGYDDTTTIEGNSTYLNNWCKLEKVFADDTTELIECFANAGSMYDKSVMYRTPRFYADRAFKKVRLTLLETTYPNASQIISQMQMYYRDLSGTNNRSFIPSVTQYDLNFDTVKHKSNLHFFITPTGVRIGSNCFVEPNDPPINRACVGNRWINSTTRLSYVCNTSGVWTREDFCEIGCCVMNGSHHAGLRLRTVLNEENPIVKYVQNYGKLGGNLAMPYVFTANGTTVIVPDETAGNYYFQAESKDENQGIIIKQPANTTLIKSFRNSLVRSEILQSVEVFAHISDNDQVACCLKAYKTFETSAAGEYVEGGGD